MSKENDPKEDPELLDDVEGDAEGLEGEQHYDGAAVETIPFDPTLFELPDDYEYEGDDDDD